jgi:hypothetical protein
VSIKDGQDFVNKHQICGFMETSAKTGFSVDQAFSEFGMTIYNRWKDRSERDTVAHHQFEIRSTKPKEGKKKKCSC